jgi:hypothetical protein
MSPLKAHYGVVAGKAEIDAIMRERRVEAAARRRDHQGNARG